MVMDLEVNRKGDRFVAFEEIREAEMEECAGDIPLTHALLVITSGPDVLLVFDRWRGQWELPGGKREVGETLRECAARELEEESGQSVQELKFVGMMKFCLMPDSRWECGALFTGEVTARSRFEPNEEIADIMYWNGEDELETLDEIDLAQIRLVQGKNRKV